MRPFYRESAPVPITVIRTWADGASARRNVAVVTPKQANHFPPMSSMPPLSLALRLLAVLLVGGLLASCKDAPGADGRYASGYPTAGPGRWAP